MVPGSRVRRVSAADSFKIVGIDTTKVLFFLLVYNLETTHVTIYTFYE